MRYWIRNFPHFTFNWLNSLSLDDICIIPYRVQGIIMLLAGVADFTDNRYTSNTWEEQAG